jgi:hypothetical protein
MNDTETGTFTPDTTPSDAQAQDKIDDAVNSILARVGPMPGTPPLAAQVCTQAARDAAAWQAAADIELAYFQRPGDVQAWTQVDQRAFEAFTTLQEAMAQFGAGDIATLPVWGFPPPPAYGDNPLL